MVLQETLVQGSSGKPDSNVKKLIQERWLKVELLKWGQERPK